MAQQQKKARKRKRVLARTTDAAEKIHRAVAGFPLDVLEQVDRLAKPVARIRKLQDRSITATYEMVRGVNRELALLTRRTPARATRKVPAKRRAAVVRQPRPTAVASQTSA